MAKATRKSQASSTVAEQPSPKNKERKMRKSSSQPRSRGSVKAAKNTTEAKRPLLRRSTKKASPKHPASSVKSKKTRGTILFGHYHRLNKNTKMIFFGHHQSNTDLATFLLRKLGME
uniref:Uncharacterized protein n=1 Tax=Equus asinus TaxID=9793 RepID=A0A9L0JAE8_EQUAS